MDDVVGGVGRGYVRKGERGGRQRGRERYKKKSRVCRRRAPKVIKIHRRRGSGREKGWWQASERERRPRLAKEQETEGLRAPVIGFVGFVEFVCTTIELI